MKFQNQKIMTYKKLFLLIFIIAILFISCINKDNKNSDQRVFELFYKNSFFTNPANFSPEIITTFFVNNKIKLFGKEQKDNANFGDKRYATALIGSIFSDALTPNLKLKLLEYYKMQNIDLFFPGINDIENIDNLRLINQINNNVILTNIDKVPPYYFKKSYILLCADIKILFLNLVIDFSQKPNLTKTEQKKILALTQKIIELELEKNKGTYNLLIIM